MTSTALQRAFPAALVLALFSACDDIGSDQEALTPAGTPVGAEFEVTSGSVPETTASVVVGVTLPQPEANTVAVIVLATGSATAGEDFDPLPQFIEIPAGQVRGQFTLNLNDDTLFEADEEIRLEIVNIATAASVGIGEDRVLTLEIVDDDVAPTVSFAPASTSAFENGGPIVLPVVLDAPSGLDVVVPVNVAGTATGEDFALTALEVVIAPGATRGDFIVEPVDDGDAEGSETLEFSFGTLEGATAGATGTATITLEDPPSAPTLREVVFTRTTAVDSGIYTSDSSGLAERLNGDLLASEHALAPGGTRVAFTGQGDAATRRSVWVVETGSAPLEVSGTESALGQRLFWAPTDDAVAYAAVRPSGQSSGLYIAEANGSGAVELAPDVSLALGLDQVQWAPSGDRIAFLAFVDSEQHLFVAHRDGTGTLDLTEAVGAAATRAGFLWSSDSARVAFRDSTGLYSARFDGTAPQTLSTDLLVGPFGSEADFAWTADATAVLFRGAPAGVPAQLFRAPADGSSAPTAISAVTQGVEAGWRVAPDGSRVAFFGRDVNGDGSVLFEAAPDGSATLQIGAALVGADRVLDCLWSPDSARVAHRVQTGGGATDLWCATTGISASAVAISGTIASAGNFTLDNYAFRSDSARIAYIDLRIINSVTGETELFSNAVTGGDERSHSGPHAWPGQRRVIDFAWSADGTRIWSRQTLDLGESSLWSAPTDQSAPEAEAPSADASSTREIIRYDPR